MIGHLKSIMAYNEKYKKAIICQFMDYEKFFDKEKLTDVLLEAKRSSISNKEYRLLYQLNKKRVISVVTPVGESEEEEVAEGLGQGGLESAILSSNSIGNGLDDFFRASNRELYYEDVRLQAWGYQDDVARASSSVEDVRDGVARLEAMAEVKLLSYNHSKSSLVVLGPKKTRIELENDLKENPVMLNNLPMKIKHQEKYLGEEICSSLAASVVATVRKRRGLVLMTINDIVSIVEDARSGVVGRIVTALKLWESSLLPFLLNSSETWLDIPNEAMNLLNEIQDIFLWKILKTPKSTPKILMYFDTGQMFMKNRVIQRKLNFLWHLSSLGEESIAYRIFEQQRKKEHLPGLIQEGRKYLEELGLSLEQMKKYTKSEWKGLIGRKLISSNEEELRALGKNYRKTDSKVLEEENFEVKEYLKTLSYEAAVFKFKYRAQMIETIKCHWKNDQTFWKDGWSCWEGCKATDRTSHVQRCLGYKHLREDLDLENDEHLTIYFKRVIEHRKEKLENNNEVEV